MNALRSLSLICLLVSSVAMGQTRLDQAIRLVDQGQYDPAKTLLQQVVKETPGNASVYYYLGLVTMGYDYEESIDYLEHAVKLDYSNAKYHFALGNAFGVKAQRAGIFSKLGAAKDCLRQFKLATQFNTKYIDARVGLIEYYLQAPGIFGGSVDKAKAEADTIIGFDPCSGYLELARVYQYQKNPDQEEQCYLKAISADPKSIDAYRANLWFYWGRKDETKAQELLSRALRAIDKKAELYYSIGLYYTQTKNLTKAIDVFQTALKQDSTYVPVYYQLGRCSLLSGIDLQTGLTYFEKYLQHDPPKNAPTWPYAHWRMGMIYEKLGNKDDARSEYQKALAMNSHLEEARKSLEELR